MKAFPLVFATGLLLPSLCPAASIGVNFVGGRSAPNNTGAGAPTFLASTDVAGVVPQANYTNVAGFTGADITLADEGGTLLPATVLTFSAGATYTAVTGTVPAGADEMLNNGFIAGGLVTVTVTGVPYGIYDLYVYTLNDAVRTQAVTLQPSTAYHLTAPGPGGAGFVDRNAGTPFNYIQATSTTAGTPTNPANYVKFSSLTGDSFTFQAQATTSNAFVNGFQIVQIPEPSGAVLGLAGLGALLLRRRRRAD